MTTPSQFLPAIKTNNLTKSYGNQVVLKNLNLQVEQGEIYGFLGPNGSGKSTAIMILMGIEKPTAGSYKVQGKTGRINDNGLWQKVGFVSEKQYLYESMTALEYLSFFADLYQVENAHRTANRWLERGGLNDRGGVRVSHLSNGQRQKLNIVRGLLHDPDLIILDEPVQGLDPIAVRDIRNLILDLNHEGKTIFLSSHILSEIEKTADRVGILYKGNLLVEDTMENIRSKLDQGVVYEIELNQCDKKTIDIFLKKEFVKEAKYKGSILVLRVHPGSDYREEISKLISGSGKLILGWEKKDISLEEAFLTITEQEISLLTERI